MDCLKPCPLIYDPVCGSDGETYGNSCTFEVEQCKNPGLKSLLPGECPQDIGGKFNSSSNLKEPTEAFYQEPMDCLKPCPLIYDPVCGSDGETYGNSCIFEGEQCKNPGLKSLPGECPQDIGGKFNSSSNLREPTHTHPRCLTVYQDPMDCLKPCPLIYDPVCGSDGETYGNSCIFEVEQCKNPGLKSLLPGECPQDFGGKFNSSSNLKEPTEACTLSSRMIFPVFEKIFQPKIVCVYDTEYSI
ncbi:Four-domain proteases inhibitor [Holothuria leucospilota]|uniref:Four-domain proteases inhibitor n=1 Tax=Holothuria leucospilota TaxID=206669 RepID=A0A9Q1CN72_HOLLE|nr:Four-domain proteases inhibitor [Holothuria leucospilota]